MLYEREREREREREMTVLCFFYFEVLHEYTNYQDSPTFPRSNSRTFARHSRTFVPRFKHLLETYEKRFLI